MFRRGAWLGCLDEAKRFAANPPVVGVQPELVRAGFLKHQAADLKNELRGNHSIAYGRSELPLPDHREIAQVNEFQSDAVVALGVGELRVHREETAPGGKLVSGDILVESPHLGFLEFTTHDGFDIHWAGNFP